MKYWTFSINQKRKAKSIRENLHRCVEIERLKATGWIEDFKFDFYIWSNPQGNNFDDGWLWLPSTATVTPHDNDFDDGQLSFTLMMFLVFSLHIQRFQREWLQRVEFGNSCFFFPMLCSLGLEKWNSYVSQFYYPTGLEIF